MRTTTDRLRPVRIAIILGLAGWATGCHSLPRTSFQPAHHPSQPTASILDGRDNQVKLTSAQEADVQVALGRTLERQGEIAQAMAAYQDAIARDASRADALLRMAILHDRQGQFRESAPLYQRALEARPGDPDIFSDKGYSLYLQRRWVEAEMSLRQAIVLKPDHKRAHNNLGLVLAHTGRSEPALDEFRHGGCSEADAQINMAYALTLEHRWPEARQHFQIALSEDTNSEPARLGLLQLDRLMAKNPGPPTSTPAPTPTSPQLAPRDADVATTALAAASPPGPAPASAGASDSRSSKAPRGRIAQFIETHFRADKPTRTPEAPAAPAPAKPSSVK
ncbi:MAG TPA: tetratricopeptide repeat protein [Isosphaeraceae bacterium]|jgi:Flp pilus assembly protein TadD